MDNTTKTYLKILDHALERISDELDTYTVKTVSTVAENKAHAMIQLYCNKEELISIRKSGESSIDVLMHEACSVLIYDIIGAGVLNIEAEKRNDWSY